jgi:hypothetical protein
MAVLPPEGVLKDQQALSYLRRLLKKTAITLAVAKYAQKRW